MRIRGTLTSARSIGELLGAAERIARESGDRLAGEDHLLLAAVDHPDGTARRALARVGIEASVLQAAVEAQYDAALAAIGVPTLGPDQLVTGDWLGRTARPYAMADSGRVLFQETAILSKQKGSPGLRSAHVLLAAAGHEYGSVARVFVALGVTPAELATAAEAEIAAEVDMAG